MIIGGGLAGLISSIQLVRAGISCTVIEKKSYPLQRVCGEYVSNEALPFLKSAQLYPDSFEIPKINFLEISSADGSSTRTRLDLGGFGISRYSFDHHLYTIAKKEGVAVFTDTEVTAVHYMEDSFSIEGSFDSISSDVVIGAFGKRSKIDVQQNRKFLQMRSPYVGVKYHVKNDHPRDLISLHNFPGGYCGVCAVDQHLTNVCYLTHRDNVRRFGNIQQMEREVLFGNPQIREVFTTSSFVFDKPEVINEISFETKGPVDNHILMAGDAAGMITPVCGNGMAIAIRSAKMVSDAVKDFCAGRINRKAMEDRYRDEWNAAFRQRLWFGRQVQRLFGNPRLSRWAVKLAGSSQGFAGFIVRNTHGKPF